MRSGEQSKPYVDDDHALSTIGKKIKSIENAVKLPANLGNKAVIHSLQTTFQEINNLLVSISSEQRTQFYERIEVLRNIIFPSEGATAAPSTEDRESLTNSSRSSSALEPFLPESSEDWTTVLEGLPGKINYDQNS